MFMPAKPQIMRMAPRVFKTRELVLCMTVDRPTIRSIIIAMGICIATVRNR